MKRDKLADMERNALTALFGGVRPFLRATGLDAKTVYRWTGNIPPRYNAAIREAAAREGVPLDAVNALLVNVCPCCGVPV